MSEVIGKHLFIRKTVKELEEVHSYLRVDLEHLSKYFAKQGIVLVQLLELQNVVVEFSSVEHGRVLLIDIINVTAEPNTQKSHSQNEDL